MLKLEIVIKKLNSIVKYKKIIELLSDGKEYEVGGIANGLRIAHSAMSHTLKRLDMLGIVIKRKKGSNVLVKLNIAEMKRIQDIVTNFNKLTYERVLSAPPVEQF